MKRNFRLTRSTDFKRVRNAGKSYAHPLLVLVVNPAAENSLKIGVTAGRSVGGAVQRNRAKRLLREAMRPYLTRIACQRRSYSSIEMPTVESTGTRYIRMSADRGMILLWVSIVFSGMRAAVFRPWHR